MASFEAEHLLTVRSSAGRIPAAAVGLYGTEAVVATAGRDKQLQLHRPFCKTHETSWQSTHSTAVEQLAFSLCSPLWLASASPDCLLLWQLEDSLPLPPGGAPPCRRVQLPPLSCLGCLCFSPSAQYLVLCDGADALVCGAQSCQLEGTLRGHSSLITHATFHPLHSHTLITTSQDRTFKVWDVERCCVQYQSPVMSAVPLTCAAVNSNTNMLAIGAADGKLWLLDVSAGGGYRCLLECDVWRERDRHACLSATGTGTRPGEEREEEGGMAEAGAALLRLHFWHSSAEETADTHISEVILRELDGLVVVGHSAILIFNPNTLQATSCFDFRDPVPSSVCPPSALLPTSSSCAMTTCSTDAQVYCVLEGMFERTVSLLMLGSCTQSEKADRGDIRTDDDVLSVLSSAPLVPNSPLRSEFTPKPHPSASTVKRKPGAPVKKGGTADKPLTFKSKVKSSGYTETPRMKMFAPAMATAASSRRPPKPSAAATARHRDRRQQAYPVESEPPTALHSTLQPLERPTPLSPLRFSGDGQYVGCGAADKAVYLMKMPPSQQRIQALVGHDGTVHSVDWSHDGQWVLSGSADRTARLWTPAQKDPLLTISHTLSNTSNSTGSGSGKMGVASSTSQVGGGSPRFPADVSHAMFYYLDKFLLLSSCNILYLYKYHIDSSPTDDIKRYRSLSRYKLVCPLTADSMQNITALSCVNDFLSPLVLVGGSSKSVEVFDMNVAQRVRTMADCHTRPPHCIAMNRGSRGVSHPAQAYNLFLTAAPVDGIKLWDLRTNRCVRRLSGHVNRCHQVQAEFSPCSRYVATGSEDRAAYIYDLRSLSPLHRLSGHSDIVTSLSFHPLRPMLATATLDGHIRFFTSTDCR